MSFFDMDKEQRDSILEETDDYKKFTEKFRQKKTSDDCYTPPKIYNAVAKYVALTYNLDEGNFIRPFYPGGDYENYGYKEDDVIVDNPPFSMITKIVRFYTERNIRYFLFCPGLTCFSIGMNIPQTSFLITDHSIVYENGAKVNTNFWTNLEKMPCIKTAVTLNKILKHIQGKTKERVKREYPISIVTESMLEKLVRADIDVTISRDAGKFIRKTRDFSIYGCGFELTNDDAIKKWKGIKDKVYGI